jgi:hypothetical protein
VRVSTASLLATVLVVALGPPLGCGGNHDRLAKEDTTSSAGGGGVGGEGGTTTSTTGGMGGAGGIVEPPGPTTLTVVNGIVDADAVRLCFEAFPDPEPGTLPWPGVAGLPFARGAVVDPLEDLVPEDGDVEVLLVAGDLSASGGQTCEDLATAPPAEVLVFSLGVIPASVFDEEKSLIFVTGGCVGGEGHTDEDEEDICGLGYSEARPNPSLIAGFMSRLGEVDRVAMQFVQASAGLPAAAVQVRPGDEIAVGQIAAPDWSYGAIAPFPPFDQFSVATLLDVSEAEVQILPDNGSTPFEEVSFADAFANSTLSPADVKDGLGFTFVGVGAPPAMGSGSWWNGYAFTVVSSTP